VQERRCIYCLEDKPTNEFNTEHVIPQAFGKFGGQSPTVDCVCERCNSRLGKELEQSFSYSSVEGFHRLAAGLKSARDFRPDLASDIDGILIREGPVAGCIADFRPSLDGTTVDLILRPQVGFAKTHDGPFQWHSPGCLPTKEQLQAEFGSSPPCVRWVGAVDDRQILAELTRKCRLVGGGEILVQNVQASVARVDVLATVTQKHIRTIAKIAFNYLAFAQRGLAYLPELNDLRRYVLAGTCSWTPIQKVVAYPADSRARLKWHAVSIRCTGNTIFGVVVPLGILRYTLLLNPVPLPLPATFASGHRFDLQTRQAKCCPLSR